MVKNTEETCHQRTDNRQNKSYSRLIQTFRQAYGQGITVSAKMVDESKWIDKQISKQQR